VAGHLWREGSLPRRDEGIVKAAVALETIEALVTAFLFGTLLTTAQLVSDMTKKARPEATGAEVG
jgi:hypothetical protein